MNSLAMLSDENWQQGLRYAQGTLKNVFDCLDIFRNVTYSIEDVMCLEIAKARVCEVYETIYQSNF